jgi:thiol-disulfide isomerase/thioredoxin
MKLEMSNRTIIFVCFIAAGILLLVGGLSIKRNSTEVPAVSTSTSRTASDLAAESGKLPVIRFVKNPEPAPALQGRDLLGKPVTKDNWPGKVVLVNFWATWCPPCREEIPELLELEKEFGDRLQIVGLSEDDDPPEKVMTFARKQGMTYPILMATQEMIDSYGGVPALPTSFLIDTQGRVVQKHSGLYPIASYREEIRSLLGVAADVRVETFEDTGQVFLKNASNATELPDVDFKGLSPEQKKFALHRMNAESCTCGCKLTISQCRVNDGECPTSRDLAAQIVRDAAGGSKTGRAVPAGNNPVTP